MLDDGTSVTLRKDREVPQAEMVRTIGIDDKFKKVMPLLPGGEAIAGTAVWARYLKLKFLRDELLHVKERGFKSDPDQPSAYDRLMLGEADSCVEDAIAVVDGAWPSFLPDGVRDSLRVSMREDRR